MGHLRTNNLTQPQSPERTNQPANTVDEVAYALAGLSVSPSQDTTLVSAIENFSLGDQLGPQFSDDSAGVNIPETETPSPDNSAGVDIQETPPSSSSINGIMDAISDVFGDLTHLIAEEVLSPRDRTLTQGTTTVGQAPPPAIRPSRTRARPNEEGQEEGEQRGFARRRLNFDVPPGAAAGTNEIALSAFWNELNNLDSTDFFPTQYQAPQSLIGTEWDSSDEEAST